MAKLAATGPAFYYPLEAMAAEKLRDDYSASLLLIESRSAADSMKRGTPTSIRAAAELEFDVSRVPQLCRAGNPV